MKSSWERRESVYGPWLEYANKHADRWEQKIAEGSFERGALNEFWDNVDDFGPALRRLGLQEKREQPPDSEAEGTFGSIIGQAIGRLIGLSRMLIEEGGKRFGENDLACAFGHS
jgi:hypothetical protein